MRAIDIHVHVPRQARLLGTVIDTYVKKYFKTNTLPKNSDEMAVKYKKCDVFIVIFSVDSQGVRNDQPDTNDYIDSSGWSLRYITDVLIKEANCRLQDKFLFGSDYALIKFST